MKELITKITEAAKKNGAAEVNTRKNKQTKDAASTIDLKIIFKRKPLKKGEKKEAPPLELTTIGQKILKDAGAASKQVSVYSAYIDPCIWLINVTEAPPVLHSSQSDGGSTQNQAPTPQNPAPRT